MCYTFNDTLHEPFLFRFLKQCSSMGREKILVQTHQTVYYANCFLSCVFFLPTFSCSYFSCFLLPHAHILHILSRLHAWRYAFFSSFDVAWAKVDQYIFELIINYRRKQEFSLQLPEYLCLVFIWRKKIVMIKERFFCNR